MTMVMIVVVLVIVVVTTSSNNDGVDNNKDAWYDIGFQFIFIRFN